MKYIRVYKYNEVQGYDTCTAFEVSVMEVRVTICSIPLNSHLKSTFEERSANRKGTELMRNDERIMIARITK